MSCLILNAELAPGVSLGPVCRDAINLAIRTGCIVRFTWRGVTVETRGAVSTDTLHERVMRAFQAHGSLVVS